MAQWRSGVCIFYIRLMEKKFKRTLVTTALPYANGPVHIGHLAGVYVPADIYTRFLRLRGEDVVMIGGSIGYLLEQTIRGQVDVNNLMDGFVESLQQGAGSGWGCMLAIAIGVIALLLWKKP